MFLCLPQIFLSLPLVFLSLPLVFLSLPLIFLSLPQILFSLLQIFICLLQIFLSLPQISPCLPLNSCSIRVLKCRVQCMVPCRICVGFSIQTLHSATHGESARYKENVGFCVGFAGFIFLYNIRIARRVSHAATLHSSSLPLR